MAGAVIENRHRFVDRLGPPVGPVGHERVVRVADRHDPREVGNRPSGQAVGVAPAVEVLVVVADDREQACSRAQRPDDALADDRMHAHRGKLPSVERSWLQQHRVGDADLADVVNDSAAVERVERTLRKPHLLSDASRGLGDAMSVPLRVRVLRFDRGREREDDLVGAVQIVVERLQPQRRADTRHELDTIDRLAHEVVGA